MGPQSTTLPRRRTTAVGFASAGVLTLATAPSGTRAQPAADQARARRRDDLIASHMALVARIARMFAGRGEDLADLTQVAMLELVRAAGLFDPARGVAFDQYVGPCVTGAIKRHFRDNGWSLQVPRGMQELCLQISRTVPMLTQSLRRTPTVADLAVQLSVSEKDIRNAMQGHWAYQTRSLNEEAGNGDGDRAELVQRLGGLDENIESLPDRHALRQHVNCLLAREQAILRLRFEAELTQCQIAELLGISQMHVSRMLARTLKLLREELRDR